MFPLNYRFRTIVWRKSLQNKHAAFKSLNAHFNTSFRSFLTHAGMFERYLNDFQIFLLVAGSAARLPTQAPEK